jgi:hypothetical protein
VGRNKIRELPLPLSWSGSEDSANIAADWNVEGWTVARTVASEQRESKLAVDRAMRGSWLGLNINPAMIPHPVKLARNVGPMAHIDHRTVKNPPYTKEDNMVSNGSLVLNGVNDAELVTILEVKLRHENSLNFNPQQLQPVVQQQQPGRPQPPQVGKQAYNNVVLTWATENGLEAVQEIIHLLLRKEEAAKAAGQ